MVVEYRYCAAAAAVPAPAVNPTAATRVHRTYAVRAFCRHRRRRIRKSFEFCASHRLVRSPTGEPRLFRNPNPFVKPNDRLGVSIRSLFRPRAPSRFRRKNL